MVMSDLSSKEIDFNAIEVPEIVTVLKALKDRRFATHYAPDAESARRIVKEIVPPGSKVGTGDSTSVNQLGIAEALEERGSTVYVAHARGRTWEETHRNHVLSYSSECKFFLTGSNAITLDGRLVNVDASGNRVAGMFYGHNESILVVGRNKIVKDLDEAFDRLRHQISPQHVKIRSTDLGGRPFKTGCVKTAQCVDCRGDDRTCNIFTVLEFQPKSQRIHVVLVNLDLGLGWDESWPDGRIGNIIEEYKKLVWVPPHNLGPSLAAVEGTSGK
jgi:hypothetical protein